MIKAKWYILVNGSAGKGRNRHIWRKVRKELSLAGIQHEGYYSRKLSDFEEQLHKQINSGVRHFIAVGGDGSLHYLINGLYHHPNVPLSEFTIACIPVGSGNDWSRTYKIPRCIKKSVSLIKKGKVGLQDLALLSNQGQDHIVVNNAGMGYDALVLRKSERMKHLHIGNRLKYIYCVFSLLFTHKGRPFHISLDGRAWKTEVFSLTLGNCPYNGGGLKQLPHAIPNDGKLDITLIHPVSPWTILLHGYRLYTGTLDAMKQVSCLQGTQISIRADQHNFIEADGELIGQGDALIRVLPNAIRFILP